MYSFLVRKPIVFGNYVTNGLVQNVHHNEAHKHWLGFKLPALDGKRNDV